MVIEGMVATSPCYNGSWIELGLLVISGLGPICLADAEFSAILIRKKLSSRIGFFFLKQFYFYFGEVI